MNVGMMGPHLCVFFTLSFSSVNISQGLFGGLRNFFQGITRGNRCSMIEYGVKCFSLDNFSNVVSVSSNKTKCCGYDSFPLQQSRDFFVLAKCSSIGRVFVVECLPNCS